MFQQSEQIPSNMRDLVSSISIHVTNSSKFRQFQRTYVNDRIAFAYDVMGTLGKSLTLYQEEILGYMDDGYTRIAVRGPHGLGKTFLAALLTHHSVLTAEDDAKTITTASAWRQLEKYLWPEIHKLAKYIRWDIVGRQQYNPLKELLGTSIRLSNRTVEAFAVASDDHNTIEGAHAKQLIYIFDEAKAIPRPTWNAAEGAFSNAKNAVLVEKTEDQIFNNGLKDGVEYAGRIDTVSQSDSNYIDTERDSYIATVRMDQNLPDRYMESHGVIRPNSSDIIDRDVTGGSHSNSWMDDMDLSPLELVSEENRRNRKNEQIITIEETYSESVYSDAVMEAEELYRKAFEGNHSSNVEYADSSSREPYVGSNIESSKEQKRTSQESSKEPSQRPFEAPPPLLSDLAESLTVHMTNHSEHASTVALRTPVMYTLERTPICDLSVSTVTAHSATVRDSSTVTAHSATDVAIVKHSASVRQLSRDKYTHAAGTTEKAFAVAISTPGDPSGQFYDIHMHKPGYEDWKTRHVTVDEAIRAGRISRDWVEQRKRQWGETSSIFQNRVLGEFADSSEEGIIPLSWVRAACERWKTWRTQGSRDLYGRHTLGVDVARGGDDKTVIARCIAPHVPELIQFSKLSVTSVAGFLKSICRNYESHIEMDGGLGAAVYDILKEQEVPMLRPIIVSANTKWRDRSKELRFANVRAAMWWNLRQMLDPQYGSETMLPPVEDLILDLTTPKWEMTKDATVRLESKESIRDRLGRSTDYGDSVCLGFWSSSSGGGAVI